MQIGDEIEVEFNPPQDWNIANDNKDEEVVEDAYNSILKEMQEFRKGLDV